MKYYELQIVLLIKVLENMAQHVITLVRCGLAAYYIHRQDHQKHATLQTLFTMTTQK